MTKSLKDTLLGTLENGPAVLNEIEVARKISPNKIYVGDGPAEKAAQLHTPLLALTVLSVQDAGAGAKLIRLGSSDGYLPPFEAGQYVNLFVEINGIRTSRPYSIASSPQQRAYYEILVAETPGGFVSDFLINQTKMGDTFEANGPAGVFHFNPVFHKKTSVFLAGGSGITPFMSMTREILESGADREIYFFYGCRKPELAYFQAELNTYNEEYPNFHYYLVLSEEVEGWTGETGYLDAALIKKLVPQFEESTYYICGPQIMNQFCQKEVKRLDISPKHVRREMFGSSTDIVNEPGWPTNLTGNETFKLTVGNQVIDAKANESILVALERSKMQVNVCCRSGECGFCRFKLVDGKVFLAAGILHRAADKKFDYIHSCKAYPISDLEIMF